MNEYEIIKELLGRHQRGEVYMNDEELQSLAEKAYQYGLNFEVGSKAIRKGLFDVADMASFGMLPNKWRARSPGQDLYGETFWDKFSGGIGTLGGLALGVGAGIKGAKAIANSFKGGNKAATALARVKEMEAIRRSKTFATSVYNKGTNLVGRGTSALGRYTDPLRGMDPFGFRYPG